MDFVVPEPNRHLLLTTAEDSFPEVTLTWGGKAELLLEFIRLQT